VAVQDVSVYGTAQGFRGYAKPGSSVFFDLAGEYSLTQRWGLALDTTYQYQGNTSVAGSTITNSGPTPFQHNSGTSDAFGLAPAIEYNCSRSIGVLLGVRLISVARNTSATVSPVLAVNFVH
jgi:hypothetical protein